MALRPSAVALAAAARAPGIARLLLRLWGRTYAWWPRQPHWLFLRLKRDLGVRLRQRARLFTGQIMVVDPFDSVGRRIARDGCYEPETVMLLQKLLQPGMVVLDVGAHVGQHSLIASRMVGEQGQVHAFEPDPATFGELVRNVSMNVCSNVTCNQTALSDNPGRAALYLSSVDNVGRASLRPQFRHSEHQADVEVRTLDEYADSAALPRIDLIKADIEGAELPLLRGGREVIGRFGPVLLLELSVHGRAFGYGTEDLVAQLEEWGYALYRVGAIPVARYSPSPEDPTWFNVLGVHRDQVPILRSRWILPDG